MKEQKRDGLVRKTSYRTSLNSQVGDSSTHIKSHARAKGGGAHLESRTWEAQTGESDLHNECQVSQDYTERPSLK